MDNRKQLLKNLQVLKDQFENAIAQNACAGCDNDICTNCPIIKMEIDIENAIKTAKNAIRKNA